MAREPLKTPQVTVLGGGGVLGEAWMSAVLAGLEEGGGFDARGSELYLGTSAGSIVAASLVAGVAPDTRLDGLGGEPSEAVSGRGQAELLRYPRALAVAAAGVTAGPIASTMLMASAPAGALIRRAALHAMPEGRRSLAVLARMIERSGVRFDGRLRIAAVQRETGRRVMFGAAKSPDVPVSLAVQASCAIPGVFAPVRVAGHTYVDGGVWSPTNMDSAEVSRGTTVLCLNPTGSLRPARNALAGAFGPVSRGIVAAEATALRHRGARVRTVNPDAASTRALGINFMDATRRTDVIEAGIRQGRALAAGAR